MKTINERAIEAYPNITAENVNEVLIARKAYIKGATEMVDKACKTYCRYCQFNCEGHPHDDCEILIEYKATLKVGEQ